MSNTSEVLPAIQKENQMQWTQAVSKLAELAMQEDACCLQMGDHLNVIEGQWKSRSKMKLAAQEAGVTWSLARQRSWVAKQIPPYHPLRETQLTYCHLRAVAGTKDPEKWGLLAVQNNWSVAMLKEQIDLAEDKEAQQTGEICIFCETAMDEGMEIVSFRIGQRKTLRCCSCQCAADYLRREVEQAAGGDLAPAILAENESFSL